MKYIFAALALNVFLSLSIYAEENNSLVDKGLAQKLRQKVELLEKEGKYGPEHPVVIRLKNAIAILEPKALPINPKSVEFREISKETEERITKLELFGIKHNVHAAYITPKSYIDPAFYEEALSFLFSRVSSKEVRSDIVGLFPTNRGALVVVDKANVINVSRSLRHSKYHFIWEIDAADALFKKYCVRDPLNVKKSKKNGAEDAIEVR